MLNKIQIIGRLGRDPEVRYTQSGTAIANFSVATTEKYKGSDGNMVENTEWHKVVAFGRLGEVCGEYLAKGSLVYAEGKVQTREWEDKDGGKRYTTEIVIREMKMLSGKGESSGGGRGDNRGEGRGDSEPQNYEDVPF
jgi:single-strand DNA-binding protein